MTEKRIRLERQDKIAVVTMDRPEKRNAFDADMFEALEKAAKALSADLPRAVVLTGAGDNAFSAGFDVGLDNPMTADFLNAVNLKDAGMAAQVIRRMRQAVDAFAALPVPLIAGVNGLAYGGGAELATRCDLRLMDAGARLCFSEVKLGLMPDWGGGPSLSRLIGPGRAADLILSARVVPAKEALALGWANRISEEGRCLEEAVRLAQQISRNGPKAVRAALAVLRQSPGLPLDKALDIEAEVAGHLVASGECLHGITAFMEKNAPDFPD